MTWYQIREGGEPVALVASIDLAREIVSCQSPGYYSVDEIQDDPLDSEPRARARRRPTPHPDGRHGDGPRLRSTRMTPSRRRAARQTDPRSR
jgi:hypothetical protein